MGRPFGVALLDLNLGQPNSDVQAEQDNISKSSTWQGRKWTYRDWE